MKRNKHFSQNGSVCADMCFVCAQSAEILCAEIYKDHNYLHNVDIVFKWLDITACVFLSVCVFSARACIAFPF